MTLSRQHPIHFNDGHAVFRIETRMEPERALVEDLDPSLLVTVVCRRCGHAAQIRAKAITDTLAPEYPVVWIGRAMKCSKCGIKGASKVRVDDALRR